MEYLGERKVNGMTVWDYRLPDGRMHSSTPQDAMDMGLPPPPVIDADTTTEGGGAMDGQPSQEQFQMMYGNRPGYTGAPDIDTMTQADFDRSRGQTNVSFGDAQIDALAEDEMSPLSEVTMGEAQMDSSPMSNDRSAIEMEIQILRERIFELQQQLAGK